MLAKVAFPTIEDFGAVYVIFIRLMQRSPQLRKEGVLSGYAIPMPLTINL